MADATKSHFNTGWQDQHERVSRWHKRLSAIRRGIPTDMSQAEALDEIYAFFMNCYHLRDWIINSEFKLPADVDAFIRGNPDMALCRDICTGLKHFRIRAKGAYSAANWSTASMVTYFFPGGMPDEPIASEHWVFTTGETSVDMFDLADRCVAAWDRFIAGA
jgi:hypothetical protein